MPRTQPRTSATPAPPAPAPAKGDLTPVVGANLRKLRVKRGLSLERLAQASGVSRAMLSQIELGRSTPTINVVWRIARALEVPFSALIAARRSRRRGVGRGAGPGRGAGLGPGHVAVNVRYDGRLVNR